MRRFQLLLFNTIQKEFRSKTLIMVSVITVVMILLMNALLTYLSKEVLTQLSMEGAANGTATALIFIISKFTSLLAIIFGVNCIKSDLENSVAPLMLSFPVSRLEYVLSRILGSWIIVMAYYLFSVFLAQILLSSSLGGFVGGPHLIGAMVFMALGNLVIILFSAFLGISMPKIMAFMMTSFTSLIVTGANTFYQSKDWAEMTTDLNFFKGVGLLIHGIIPRIGNIDDIGRSILMQKDDLGLSIPMELGHYAVTLTLFFGVFYLLFSRREI